MTREGAKNTPEGGADRGKLPVGCLISDLHTLVIRPATPQHDTLGRGTPYHSVYVCMCLGKRGLGKYTLSKGGRFTCARDGRGPFSGSFTSCLSFSLLRLSLSPVSSLSLSSLSCYPVSRSRRRSFIASLCVVLLCFVFSWLENCSSSLPTPAYTPYTFLLFWKRSRPTDYLHFSSLSSGPTSRKYRK